MKMSANNKWNRLTEERDRNRKWLEDNIFDLEYAGLYLGDEMNTFHFDWDGAVRDGSIEKTWRVVISNLMATHFTMTAPAVALFYQELHEYYPDWVVERSLCPPTELDQELMEKDGIHPFAVESGMPLKAFDVLCLSIDLSGSPVAVPWMIKESGIPLHAEDRGEDDSFVILGGSALVNPEPFSPFCDIQFLGEGEEILPQLLSMMEEGRRKGLSREEILLRAAQSWDCIYVPEFYEERYDGDGHFDGTFPLRDDVPKRIRFSRVRDLDKVFMITKPFVNFGTSVVYNEHYEISRGCEGKCAFCMGGFSSLPYRIRSAELVKQTLDTIIRETGNTSVTPVSFNTVSHPDINRIISDLTGEFGDKVRLISMRMDGFHDNPELCCFISMQTKGRMAFGVEGASQRLRDLVSKNLTEERILDTMREVCRSGYYVIKFMMICNLPTESEEDLDELYELAVKIRRIFEEETPPGGRMPRLLFSWNPLKVSPHTPLQWTGVRQGKISAFDDFAEKVKGLGFNSVVHENTADEWLTNLFLRGDRRLAALLEYMAERGEVRHQETYSDEAYDRAVRFLHDNQLPPVDEWFREYGLDEPLPWDIVESPASKEYLKKRCKAMHQRKPVSDPVCTESCSGCGACDSYQREQLRSMPARREKDRKIDLHHPVRREKPVHVQHVQMMFTYDRMHSVVVPSYWDCEIRRALFKAGVSFDPDSVECFGSRDYAKQIASGFNVTSISLCSRYDLSQLKELIEEHAVNFRVDSIDETDRPLRPTSVTYRIRLPEGTDPVLFAEKLKKKQSEKEWLCKGENMFSHMQDLKRSVKDVFVQDNELVIVLFSGMADPMKVYRYLLDLPRDKVIRRFPVRTGFTFEKTGVLDLARTRDVRDAYIRSLGDTTEAGTRDEALEAYISSNQCLMDIDRLIRRDYLIYEEGYRHHETRERLAGLIGYTAGFSGIAEEDDPAFLDYSSIRDERCRD